MVNIEINGKALEVPEGTMVLEAADNAAISIPRFCYHSKLSLAASCRMCLVEVDKAPKPLPACATPVGEGMKIPDYSFVVGVPGRIKGEVTPKHLRWVQEAPIEYAKLGQQYKAEGL